MIFVKLINVKNKKSSNARYPHAYEWVHTLKSAVFGEVAGMGPIERF